MKPVAGLVLLTVFVGSAWAAQHNSTAFEGTWTLDTARSDSSAPGRKNQMLHAAQVIRMVGQELSIESTRNGARQLARYPTKVPVQPEAVGTSGSSTVGTLVTWDGTELTTSTPIQINGKTMTVYERRYLSPAGDEMTVETSLRVEHGYSGQATNYEIVKDVYVRPR